MAAEAEVSVLSRRYDHQRYGRLARRCSGWGRLLATLFLGRSVQDLLLVVGQKRAYLLVRVLADHLGLSLRIVGGSARRSLLRCANLRRLVAVGVVSCAMALEAIRMMAISRRWRFRDGDRGAAQWSHTHRRGQPGQCVFYGLQRPGSQGRY